MFDKMYCVHADAKCCYCRFDDIQRDNSLTHKTLFNCFQMDVIDFPNIHLWLDHPSQYRWLQVIYQVGVFVSRSSLSCFQTNQIWLMSALQFANVIYFTVQAIFMTVPTIWFVFLVVFWEGLLGGCCYINTYNRISQEVQTEYRSFAMGVTTIGQSSGIVVAGLLTIPIHTWICSTPAPFNAFRTIK